LNEHADAEELGWCSPICQHCQGEQCSNVEEAVIDDFSDDEATNKDDNAIEENRKFKRARIIYEEGEQNESDNDESESQHAN